MVRVKTATAENAHVHCGVYFVRQMIRTRTKMSKHYHFFLKTEDAFQRPKEIIFFSLCICMHVVPRSSCITKRLHTIILVYPHIECHKLSDGMSKTRVPGRSR